MNKLIPQTVYVKAKPFQKADAQLTFPLTSDKSVLNGMPMNLEEKPNQYIFSKEELIELLRTFFISGQEYENNTNQARTADNNGWSHVSIKKPHYTELINNLF